MNSYLAIQVRVLAAQAQRQLAVMQAQLGGVSTALNGAGAASGRFNRQIGRVGVDRFGSQMQWLGRQLQYNFTLPIVAAGIAATTFAMQNEAAMVRVEKVYGDAAHGAQYYSKELQALERNFVALSNQYGVQQKQVIAIAADWAAAGASGIALAKSVDLTLKTMVLGEMQATDATKALIAIQAQYGFSTAQLTDTIATLNMVENQTGISMSELVQGFARAAGVARTAGVDTRHLAAMLAALSPAAGSASQAGNALKTIISRLLSPTKEAVEVLDLMGISVSDMAWKSSTAMDRLLMLARAFDGLSDSQKGVVSSVLASRFQINKFEVLMRELISTTGYYQKALDSTASTAAVYTQMHRELNAVLTSNPKRLQVIWTMLQNAAADIIQPMIPLILALAAAIQNAVTWFSNLNPSVQKLVLIMLLLLAVVGPVVQYIGALRILFAELGAFIVFLLSPLKSLYLAFVRLITVRLVAWATSIVAAFRIMAAGIYAAMVFVNGFVLKAFVELGLIMFSGIVRITALWRAFSVALPVIAAEAWYAIRAIWFFSITAIQQILIAGSMLAGVIYRNMMTFLATLTVVGGRALTLAWAFTLSGIQNLLLGFAVFIGSLWRSIIAVSVAATVALGTGIKAALLGLVPMLKAIGAGIVTLFSGPWGWALAAVIIVIIAFHKQIVAIWNNIVNWFRSNSERLGQAFRPVVRMFEAGRNAIIRAFNALPRGVQNALLALVRTVRAAAMAVYRLFSYLNPWARHSPSLVENVTTGVSEIIKQYQRLGDVGDIFARAGLDLESFGAAVAKLQALADSNKYAEMRKDVAAVAADALPQFDKLVAVLTPLRNRLAEVSAIQTEQQSIVDDLKRSLDSATAAYEEQDAILKQLQDTATGYSDLLDSAKSNLNRFADAAITGMQAMSDAIFETDLEQKRLQYQLMQMEDALGPMDDLQSRIESINGQIELLRGEQNSLRDAGAGSEILSQYDQQIALLEQQQDAIEAQVSPLQDLSNQIDELGRKAQMLDLENSLRFDPLNRQIDQLASSMEELPFSEIIEGVRTSRAEVDQYSAALASANAAVANQQIVVDQYKVARDALQASYDLENSKLEAIKDSYTKVNEVIQQITGSLQDMGSAASQATQAANAAGSMSPGAQNFIDAAGGDFADVGGLGQLGREGGIEDQSSMIDDFTKEIAAQTKNMFGLFNFLDPIKRAWNTAWDWVKTNIGPIFSTIGDLIKSAFDKVPNPFAFANTPEAKQRIEDIKGALSTLGDVWNKVFGPEVKKLVEDLWNSIKDAGAKIWPELKKFSDIIEPLKKHGEEMYAILKPVLGVILALIGAVISGLLGALAGGLGPFIQMIGDLIAGIIRIIRGIIEFIAGVFTGDWRLAWQGIVDIFGGIVDTIWGLISGLVSTIWGLISGFVTGIVDFFVWLWDKLVGHSIIPDMVNAIHEWFQKMHDWLWGIISAVVQFFVDKWNQVVAKFNWVKDTLWGIIRAIGDKFWDIVTAIGNAASGVYGWIEDMIGRFNSIRNRFSFGGLFDGIKSAFKSAINWIIGKWNSLSFGVGPFKAETPDIGYLASGGFITNRAVAIVGEGNPMYPEYVIPTDPMYRRRAFNLFADLASQLGLGTARESGSLMNALYAGMSRAKFGQRVQMFASGGVIGSRSKMRKTGGTVTFNSTTNTTVHFHGNLEFPNVKSGADAEEFVKNLEALVGA